MARKSRKASIQAALDGQPQPAVENSTPEPAVWNAGGYVRLSIMETRDRNNHREHDRRAQVDEALKER